MDSGGSVYLGGSFYNGNLTTPTLTRIGSTDAFVIKLTSSGSVTWGVDASSRNLGITSASATTRDAAGNIYLAGSFTGDSIAFGSVTLARSGIKDAFVAKLDELMPIPDGIGMEDAVFLPNMETAVNFVMDGRPLVGEIVAVFGQGIVGLLTTALLTQFPLGGLVCFDRFEKRRLLALELGDGALDGAWGMIAAQGAPAPKARTARARKALRPVLAA